MPAQASANTPRLLTIDCSGGGVGGPSLGMLSTDIAANAENVRLSLASHTGKGTLIHKTACCELTTVTFQTFDIEVFSSLNVTTAGEESMAIG
ncbi:hypothetical protein HaLaN_21558 [Haematococcus lacustris]|uniref:Uncharacterized protein n=1 Tax=Haematococcus lacustris TaxID=44745 RepID=A0A699ZM29_HAELA|nr:hypothetical protein HaLaN_21558 [Haematococcus lacustris]